MTHLCNVCHAIATQIAHDKITNQNRHLCKECYAYLSAKGILRTNFLLSISELLKVPTCYSIIAKQTGYTTVTIRKYLNLLIIEGKICKMRIHNIIYFYLIDSEVLE